MDLKKIYYHSLLKDEFTYEITVRSETPSATVQEMRQQLKKLSEEFLPEEVAAEDLQVASELVVIAEKVKELQSKLNSLKKTKDRRVYKPTWFALHVHGYIFCQAYINAKPLMRFKKCLIYISANSFQRGLRKQ